MEREKLAEVLKDLIEVNNARITGYEKAAKQSKELDADLYTIFLNMANDSRKYAADLTNEINTLGSNPVKDKKTKTRFYQFWLDIKDTFSGLDRQSILDSCEYGEDTVQKAYNAALATNAEIDSRTKTIITNQKNWLKTAHKLIKNYRDAHWKMIA